MFRNKKFSGIDFHNNSISCATIKLERGIPVLQDIEKIKLEEDMIVGGRVSQAEVLSDLLEDALSDGYPFQRSPSSYPNAKHPHS